MGSWIDVSNRTSVNSEGRSDRDESYMGRNCLLLLGILWVLISCTAQKGREEPRSAVDDLRRIFPIKVGAVEESLPQNTRSFPESGLSLIEARDIRSPQSGYRTYLVQGKYNGLSRIYTSNGKVSRVEFAWGTRETGEGSFFRLY